MPLNSDSDSIRDKATKDLCKTPFQLVRHSMAMRDYYEH
jgi:hypothetical protein